MVSFAAYGWFSDKSTKLKQGEHNRALRQKLDADRTEFARKSSKDTKALKAREEFLSNLQQEFGVGLIRGRKWLARFIAEADQVFDKSIVGDLRSKRRPAYKAAEEVSLARAERRAYKEKLKFLEYQLQSYKEYFPFLEEYEDAILDEAITLVPGEDNIEAIENADPVLRYVQKSEFESLSSSQRNQLALDRYLAGKLSQAGIGRMYERYLGYLYERDGWFVEYHGIVEGYEDLGRDLICTKDEEVQIVQAKCWSAEKVIREKHLFQLFGTTQMYLMYLPREDLLSPSVSSVFTTTTVLSDVARQAAKWLKINVKERFPLAKDYPMIKCNINQSSKEKIYHLPFDQQYDRTKIVPRFGEFYASTVAEAERRGFRRAYRFSGPFA